MQTVATDRVSFPVFGMRPSRRGRCGADTMTLTGLAFIVGLGRLLASAALFLATGFDWLRAAIRPNPRSFDLPDAYPSGPALQAAGSLVNKRHQQQDAASTGSVERRLRRARGVDPKERYRALPGIR